MPPSDEGGGSYGGIAAEIGGKNMPPACFLNTPTEGETINTRGPAKRMSLPQSPSVAAPSSEGAKGDWHPADIARAMPPVIIPPYPFPITAANLKWTFMINRANMRNQ